MDESTISEIANSLTEQVAQWTQAAGQAVDEVKGRTIRAFNSAGRTVDETLANAKYHLQSAAGNARYHVRRTADEKPLQLIAGVAAAAFVAGVLLRVWRSNQHV
ncbi:MAG: hypothetical protein M3O09_11605 [Acidobacteriota bacterium]|nr:hypothetical protein [Acidobacteriota bacterium]